MWSTLFFLAAVLAGLVSICVHLFYKKQYKYWKKLKVPQTRPKFPLGDIGHVCFRKSPGEVIGDLYHKSRGHRYLGVWFWYTPTLIIRDPDLIRNILVRDFDYFRDRVPYVNVRRDPLSGHIFSLRGSRWRNLRPKLTPAFTSGRMKSFFARFADCAQQLTDAVGRDAEENGIVDMGNIAARFTTDVTVSYSLGTHPNCLKNPKAIFCEMGRKIFATTLYNCFHQLVPLFISSMAKILAVTPTPSEVSTFFLDVAKEALAFRENSDKGNDFMQCLVDLKQKKKLEVTDRVDKTNSLVTNWDFTPNEAAAQAYIFFLAGIETSSLIIQYALYEMSINPVIQTRARTEILSVLEKHGKMTYDALNEMDYLNKVIQETLRKYPVVPLVFRTCTKDYPVPDSDLVIPKGMQLQVSVYGLHRDPDHFPEPDRFDPERFTEEEKAKRHNYVYLPFGDGPRNCIGMRFSLLQKKIALAALLSKFNFQVCHRTGLPLNFHPKSFFFTPKGGMFLRVTQLKDTKN